MSIRLSQIFATLFGLLFSVSTLASDPSFLKVTTIAASDKAHDVLKTPAGVAIMRSTGDVIVADTSHHRILRISPAGDISVLAGTGKPGQTDGPGAQAQFKQPSGVAVDDSRGMIYVADTGNHVIRSITFNGLVSTLAGSGHPDDFKQPAGIAVNAAGTIFVADTGNSRIRQVTPSGIVTTIAGAVHEGYADGAANVAQFKQPEGIAAGPDGALYIADTKNNVIRKLVGGTVSTIAGTGHGGFVDGAGSLAEFKEPSGITCDESGNVYVADVKNHAIRRIAANGSVTTVTGSGKAGFTDGNVDTALFREPAGIAFAGGLWIADSGNDAIRRIDAAVTISAINPTTGAAAGGTQVHIFGAGFVPGATQVTFGAAQATNTTYVNSTELVVTAPAVVGTVDVTVTTPGGRATLDDAYSTTPPPTIATVTPVKGKTAGGEVVTITGTNFIAGMAVQFGATSATGVAITSSNSLTAVTPAKAAGTVDVSVATSGGTATRPGGFTYFAPPVISAFSPASGVVPTNVTITGSNFDVDPGATTVLIGSVQTPIVSITPVQIVVTVPASATTGRFSISSTGGTVQSATSFTVSTSGGGGSGLPPDPQSIATPVDIHAVADFNSTIQFLYTGPNAIQTGVTTGAIINTFTSVIRGQVLTDSATPLSGARVSVHAHPEFGSTLTRIDGRYDLVVNGGTTFAIDFAKSGFITAQRDAHVERGDFAATADVMLIPYDAQATTISAGSDALQVARGSQVVDGDGARQATLLFPAGTAATMTLPNGTTQALQTLTVRATEYTVGANGPKRMPAVLPAQTGYTYAAEFSVDEAVAAGANEVQFSKAVATYVDNFLHFPTGAVVPSGYYDRRAAAWVPSDNGRVIAVLSVSNGLADLDTDGDGAADNGLGIDDGERQQLASLYTAGQTLWRVPITHFTTWDYNWTSSPPDDAIAPGAAPGSNANPDGKDMTPSTETTKDDACKASGSIIECENQTLGEEVPITGTPFSLHYESDRVAGRDTRYAVRVPLTPHVMPASMTSVEVKVTVAGRTITKSYAPAPDLADRIVWDGVDAYGRALQGSRPATVEVSYIYPSVYRLPGDATRAWASVTGLGVSVGVPARNTISISRSWNVRLGGWRNPKDDFGGWTISPQHTYDWLSKTILGGNGERRTGVTAAGNGITGIQSFGSSQPNAIAYGPDGSLYIGDRLAIRRVKPNASTSTVIASISGGAPSAIAADREGNVFYSQLASVFKVAPDGTRTVVIGNGVFAAAIDGAVGPDSPMFGTASLAVGPDGALYFTDVWRILKLGRDGIVHVIYGTETRPSSPDALLFVGAMTFDGDGNLLIADTDALRIRKLSPMGQLTTIAGTGCVPSLDDFCSAQYLGDGGPALAAHLAGPRKITAAPDGSIYFYDTGVTRSSFQDIVVSLLRRISPDTTITTEAIFTTDPGFYTTLPPSPNDLAINNANDLTIGPDGQLHIADAGLNHVVHFGSSMPGFSATDSLVPSPDGTALFDFNSVGRHVKTIDTYTKAVDYAFTYDTTGRLMQITDVNGRATTIERGTSGVPSAIVSPDGARTTLSVGTDGYLASVQNPAGETSSFTYDAGGLLKTFRDARGRVSTMTYDATGRLLQDVSSSGSFTSASRTGDERRFRILRGSAEGRTWTYDIDHGSDNLVTQTTTAPDGTKSIQTTNLPDLRTSTTTAQGTTITTRMTNDPRFGRQAPMLASSDVFMPSGLHLSLTHSRSISRSAPLDSLSMTFSSDTTTINGRTWTNEWTAATRTVSYRSPVGRTGSMIVDVRGLPLSMQTPTLTPVTYTYGAAGRLSRMQQGSRSVSLTYDGRGRVSSVTDPLSRTLTYTYDEADRPLTQQLADGRVVTFTYDEGGNVTSIAPPSRPAHAFHYTQDALVDTYTPPAVPNSGVTTYSYNNDHQLKVITRADSQTIALDYDAAGRIAKLTTTNPTLDYAYDAAGRLASVTNSSGPSLSYAYDGPLLTLQRWTGEVSGSVGFTFDNDLRVASENGIAFGYDDDGLLTTAGALTLQRDTQTGLVTGATLASISDAWTYNTFGEPMTHAVSIAGSEALREVYTRDDAGRITQIVESVSGTTTTTTYNYDPAGRLSGVTRDSQPVASYAYDANGNRSGGTYDDQDRLLTLIGTTYTYTKNGELATKSDASGVTEYKYDPFANLQTVLLPDGKRIDYVLDAQSRRVGKKVNGTLVVGWLYADQTRIVAETDGAGVVTKRFVYATRANAPDYMLFNGVTYRFVADHLGSPRYILEASAGTLVESLVYDEFGNLLSDSNPGYQPFGFAGGLRDRDTGLVHFGARDYDPHIGRWTAKDPVGFNGGDADLYAYSGNDPVNFYDPSGLDPLTTDPHVQEIMMDLWKRASYGMNKYEHAAWLTHDPTTGHYGCVQWPSTFQEFKLSLKKGSPIPSDTVAIIHTHPAPNFGRTQEPNDAGDVAVAEGTGFPVYTITKLNGVGKYDPATHKASRREAPSINFPNAAKDGCGCQ